jgi:hypothetical protein
MTENGQTQYTYRLVNDDDEVMEQDDLPTDGEAVAWAEEVRGRTPGLTVRRVERLDENNDRWVLVPEGGTLSMDDEDL